MLRLLHLADLHLGWNPRFLGPAAGARQRERDGLLARAVDFVLNEQPVDLVLIAGDLFETHKPDAALVEYTINHLSRLDRAGVAVVTVPGNHDEITYHDSVYRVHGGRWPGVLVRNPMPEHVETLHVNGSDVYIYGLAYTGGLTRTRPPIDRFPRVEGDGFHIAVFHGSLDWDAGERSLPLSSEALAAARYDYIALGHIHRPSQHKIGSGVAVYPGAIEGKGFSDPGIGTYTIAALTRVDGGGAGSRVHVELTTFPAGVRPVRTLELDITALADMDAVYERIKAEAVSGSGAEQALLRVRLVGASPGTLDVESLHARLGDACYYLEISDETTTLDDAVMDHLALEPTVRGEFVRRMRQHIAAAADEGERALFTRALRRGLAALEGTAS